MSTVEAERLFTGRKGRLAVALALGWGALLLGRSAVAPLLPRASVTLGLSPSTAGFALTVMMAMHSLLQYPAGRLSDRLSRATLLVVSLVTAIVGFALLMRARTYAGFLLGTATVGSGTGLYFTPSRALLSDQYDERIGQAIGLQTTAGLTGAALAGGLATVVAARTDWQYAFLVPLVAVAATLGAVHVLRTEPYDLDLVSLDVTATGRRLLARPDVRRLLAVTTLRSLVNQALMGFLPLLLLEARGFSPIVANGSYAALFLVGAVVSPIAGRTGDRSHPGRVVVALLACAAAGVTVLLVARTVPFAILGVLVLSVGTWGIPPVMQSLLLDRVPEGSVGGDFGALKLVYTGLGSAGPTIFGLVVGFSSYAVGLVGCVAALLVAAGLMATVPDA